MTRLEKLHGLVEFMDTSTLNMNEWNKCFAGVACAHLEFEAIGLFLNDDGVPAFSTTKDNYEGFEALAVFFGLLPREAFYLFAMCEYERHTDTEALGEGELLMLFLRRLAGIIQQRKDNYGHAPRR